MALVVIVALLITWLAGQGGNSSANYVGVTPTPKLMNTVANATLAPGTALPFAGGVVTGYPATLAGQPIPTNYILRGIDMVSPSLGWAVGTNNPDNQHGILLKYMAGQWVDIGIHDVHSINSVFMNSADEGWAVGSQGDIIHYNGDQWSKAANFVDQQLNSVSLTAVGEGWAVGNGGLILSLHGGKWAKYPLSPTNENLRTVYMISAAEGWAVGGEDGGGVFIHYKDGKWGRELAKVDGADIKGYPATLYMLSPDQGWAFCNRGYIMQYST